MKNIDVWTLLSSPACIKRAQSSLLFCGFIQVKGRPGHVPIQLFRQKFVQQKSIKAYATIPKGMMGCGCSLLHRQVHEFSAQWKAVL